MIYLMGISTLVQLPGVAAFTAAVTRSRYFENAPCRIADHNNFKATAFQILLVAYAFVCREQNIETGFFGIGDERPV